MFRSIFFAAFVAFVAAWARPACAQGAPPAPIELKPSEAIVSLRHHATFQVSGGFDLDVLGNVVNGALGNIDGRLVAIRQARPYPDIYVDVPKRSQISAAFGVFAKDEIVGRIGRATYLSQPLTDAGNVAAAGGSDDLILQLSKYRERSWEVGWRRYFVLTKRAKQYANFLYGVRTIDPIQTTFAVGTPDDTIGAARLYDRSKLKSFSLELGLSYEISHFGVYAEVGGRWVQKLKRQDDDLRAWSLEALNNTGIRFYMPLQFGVLLRL